MTDLSHVALALVPGIGRQRFSQLVAAFGSPAGVLAASPKQLVQVPTISQAAVTAIRQTSLERARRVVERAEELGGVVLLPDDERFPPALRLIEDAPLMLFARGNPDLLDHPAVAIVGSRNHSRYGTEAGRHFASGLARAGLVVVSGMARGIDAIAHQAALDAGGTSIGVLGNGLGVIYPSANRALYRRMGQAGCLLTEFPPGERPHAGSFPTRNRLISGLVRVVLVVEAAEKSGALRTAGYALNQGKDVLAIPGPITSPVSVGCNQLIQGGAKPALSLRDVLEEYGIQLKGVPGIAFSTGLSDEERRVLEVVGSREVHIDRVAAGFGRPAADTLAVLTSLEIRGILVQTRGKLFRKAERI